jgi:serine phosphatase RsbU (regulator of sigma subunit)
MPHPTITLQKLFRRNTVTLVQDISKAMAVSIGIRTLNGELLFGDEQSFQDGQYPVQVEDDLLGWVGGTAQAAVIASLVSQIAAQEIEKRLLVQETLERYKELNLLYAFAAKLTGCLDIPSIAQLAIDEALRLIPSTKASLMLLNPHTNRLDVIAVFGSVLTEQDRLHPREGIAGQVFLTGQGVIVNDIPTALESSEDPPKLMSLICSPLKVGQMVLGIINLNTDEPTHYTANHLKLVMAIASQTAAAIENAKHQAERLKRERTLQELEIARKIQQASLPRTLPQSASIAMFGASFPAEQVGGDFYDFFFVDDQHLYFMIGDVSDKGVPAALFLSAVKTLIKTTATLSAQFQGQHTLSETRPDRVLTTANRELAADNDACMFVTLFCGMLNTQTGEMYYTNAGHLEPLLLHPNQPSVMITENRCAVLGIDEDAQFSTSRLVLHPGETILLYTDGVTEAMNQQHELFGEERLQIEVEPYQGLTVQAMVKALCQAVYTFTDGAPQSDDLTVFALTYRPQTTEPT